MLLPCPRSMLPPCHYLLLLSSLLLPAEGEHEPSVLYGGRLEHEVVAIQVWNLVLVVIVMMMVMMMIIMVAMAMIVSIMKVITMRCFRDPQLRNTKVTTST